jgi:hypothetical protein
VSHAEVKVLYILGIHHSGTTLLGNLTGQLDGFVSVGELRSLWRKLTLPRARCGCGAGLTACPVWRPILGLALGEPGGWAVLGHDIWQDQRRALAEYHTWRQVPALLRHRGRELPPASPAARYAAALARLYRAIAGQTGAGVIVDSSKEPTDAALLLSVPGIQAVFAQIVRDPRGTAYSIVRDRAAPRHRWRDSAYAALSWSAGNLAAAAVRRAAGPARSVLLRYEDFIARPGETVAALAELAGRPATLACPGPPGTVTLHTAHTVGGNSNRFRTGPVELREDTAWRSHLPPLDRAAVTALCSPLMARYRYRLAG